MKLGDQRDLGVGRDLLDDGLEPVARSHLDDRHCLAGHAVTPSWRSLVMASSSIPASSLRICAPCSPISGPVQRIVPGLSGNCGTIPVCNMVPSFASSTSR